MKRSVVISLSGGSADRSFVICRSRNHIHQILAILQHQLKPLTVSCRTQLTVSNTAHRPVGYHSSTSSDAALASRQVKPTETRLFDTSTTPRNPACLNARSLSPSSISPKILAVDWTSKVMSAKYVKSIPRAGLTSVAVKWDWGLDGREDAVALMTYLSLAFRTTDRRDVARGNNDKTRLTIKVRPFSWTSSESSSRRFTILACPSESAVFDYSPSKRTHLEHLIPLKSHGEAG